MVLGLVHVGKHCMVQVGKQGIVGGVIYCEATHVCYIENAREVTHVILMLLVEQG